MQNKPEGIVLELQRDCLNSDVSVSTILRKAKVIASKLDLEDLKQWIHAELQGYNCSFDDLPSHRKGSGQPKFKNPYHGWCPIISGDGWYGKMLRTVYLRQPVSELEILISGGKSDILIMQYAPVIQESLREQMPVAMECALHFPKSQVASALDYIRNKTLDWTLELEEHGIIGEGLTFGDNQKKEAQMVTNHIYGGNVGVLGSVSGDANNTGFLNAGSEISIGEIQKLITQIRESVPGLPANVQTAIDGPLTQFEADVNATTPSRSSIIESASSIRKVLEGAGGNLAASGILAALASILQ